jgi:hypothetical protein
LLGLGLLVWEELNLSLGGIVALGTLQMTGGELLIEKGQETRDIFVC